jgi:hypothetical protein
VSFLPFHTTDKTNNKFTDPPTQLANGPPPSPTAQSISMASPPAPVLMALTPTAPTSTPATASQVPSPAGHKNGRTTSGATLKCSSTCTKQKHKVGSSGTSRRRAVQVIGISFSCWMAACSQIRRQIASLVSIAKTFESEGMRRCGDGGDGVMLDRGQVV